MPKGDRTGPSGQGPGTGKASGYCYGFDSPGYTKGPGRGMGFGLGRGMRRGRGFGTGWGNRAPFQGSFFSNPDMSRMNKEDEIRLLKSEADALKRSQKDIEERLGELEKEK